MSAGRFFFGRAVVVIRLAKPRVRKLAGALGPRAAKQPALRVKANPADDGPWLAITVSALEGLLAAPDPADDDPPEADEHEWRTPAAAASNLRILNVAGGVAGLPPLIVCPRCEGQAFGQGSCGLCANFGYLLDKDAEQLPFVDGVQIAATFALALGFDLTIAAGCPPPESSQG